jgi:adenylate cyclase
MADSRATRRLAAIVVADIAGYSRIMGADEEGTLAALKAIRSDVLDPTIAQHHGRVVKTAGDGVLMEFASVVDAARCCLAVQRAMAARNADVPEDRHIAFRVGIHLGDVMVDGEDIYGDGVNVAARLEGLAQPGGLCLSNPAYEQVRDRLDIAWSDGGEYEIKNIVRPIRVWRWEVDAATAATAALPDKPSIAVLPFENMSTDPEQAYFSDGIAEDIITSLSKLSQIIVIARNSTFAYKGQTSKIQEIVDKLGVRYVVEGSVRKAGNRVRVTAQLVDHSTGIQIWADRFDRELTDIFAVQDEVTQEIVSAMALKLTAEEQGRLKHKSTKNIEAYDYFLRGRKNHWQWTKDGNAQAKAMFNLAIALDPELAPAYAFLSDERILDYINQWHGPGEHPLEHAYELAEQAIALDVTYARAHYAFGSANLWMRKHEQAFAAFQRALELDPNFASGFAGMGWVLQYSGRSEEAIEFIGRGVQLDPLYSAVRLHWLAQAYFQLGRFEEAIDILKRRIARNPNTDVSRVLLAASYGHLGRAEEARTAWADALRINPDYSLEHRRKILPYKNPADFELLVDGLRKAGVPV